MNQQQGKQSLFFLIGSVMFVLVGMFLITLLGSRDSSSTQDIRARAATDPTLQFEAIVSEVDSTGGVIIVQDLQFENADEGQEKLGAWTVTVPGDFVFSSVGRGARIMITVIPSSFNTTTKTLSATKISLANQ